MWTEGTPTKNAEADLASFNATDFTVNWGTVDATARQVIGLVFGSAGGANTEGGEYYSTHEQPMYRQVRMVAI